MKDPQDTTQHAFELLGLEATATSKEVDLAYQRRTKTSRTREERDRLTQAWRKLHTVEGRLEEGLWYYVPPVPCGAQARAGIGVGEVQIQGQDQGVESLEEVLASMPLPELPPLNVRVWVLDLLDPKHPDACVSLSVPPPVFAEQPAYRPTATSLTVEFDR